MSSLAVLRDRTLETGLVPDAVIRAAIRSICRERLREQGAGGPEQQRGRFEAFVEELRRAPLAIETDAANRQHYEVPAAFFEQVLGPHLKYSSAWWPEGVSTLAAAERAMLDLTCERAALDDGQRILELGCGWGSLTLHMARRHPAARIVALSNSRSQKTFIDARARSLGLSNVEVVTCDIRGFETAAAQFDRVVSVEMFEHLRNYETLMAQIARWLTPGGALFVHVFAHARFAYPYEVRGNSDWMAEHFFTGGLMPSVSLLPHFRGSLSLEDQWTLDGTHYARTSEAWLANMDRAGGAVSRVLAETYGARDVTRWRVRWRVFFMACAELFGYDHGREWLVAHYRFRNTGRVRL